MEPVSNAAVFSVWHAAMSAAHPAGSSMFVRKQANNDKFDAQIDWLIQNHFCVACICILTKKDKTFGDAFYESPKIMVLA